MLSTAHSTALPDEGHEAVFLIREVIRKRTPVLVVLVHGLLLWKPENDMTAAIVRLFPRASAASVANIETLVSLGIFSGIGLLLSLSVLILDKYTPGEWFWSTARPQELDQTSNLGR
jgi:hypothetical protein